MAKCSVGLVSAGLAMIAVTYGLARFAYGLFLPELRKAFDLDASILGAIGAGSYAGYCGAIVISLVYTSRVGPRSMIIAAGLTAVVGMTVISTAPNALFLAFGVIVAGSSTGLASPPMAEAVSKIVDHPGQDRANALINSGTSVGVALSGPVALLATGQWRLAWAAFAAVGIMVLVWNIFVMPSHNKKDTVEDSGYYEYEPQTKDIPDLTLTWLVGNRSLRLFAASVGVGIASAVYWTFSRELVIQAGGLGQLGSTLFWVVIGVSGLAGGGAGDLVRRFGLGMAMRGSLLAMAVSIGMLAIAPGILYAAYASAALFGATYIMLTGILLVWSVRVFRERPSAGLGSAFFLLAAGQILGSYLAGLLAGITDLSTTFLIFAGTAILTTVFGPDDKDS
ncbi:MAG: MFS transporter [Rubrobacteraceae bacterium]